MLATASVASAAWSAGYRVNPAPRQSQARKVICQATEVESTASFETLKAATIEGLRREYDSFFQPMEMELYNENVEFVDPLISLAGPAAYQKNVEMLAGKNAFGKLLFADPGLILHSVEEGDAPNKITTRWTLQFRFKLLPWAPLAQFSGVSRYTLDDQARVLKQNDFWDSINLGEGGKYEPAPKSAGLSDLLGQLAPQKAGAMAASEKELPYVLLRRTKEYQVRRYPLHVSVGTTYERRIDAFGTLGAYTNGANENTKEVAAYVPSLMSVPPPYGTPDIDGMTPRGDGAPDKWMRWPLSVPSRREENPPKPNERLASSTSLDVIPSKVVAVLPFSEPTTERNVRGFANLLRSVLKRDGLIVEDTDPLEEFRLAQFDALNSLGARRSEIWFEIKDSPWH